jgi:hypothetical protein
MEFVLNDKKQSNILWMLLIVYVKIEVKHN